MKLGDFTTPNGAKGNIFSIGNWVELVLGAAVFLIAFATGQKLVQKLPANPVLDNSIEQPWKSPAAAGASYEMI